MSCKLEPAIWPRATGQRIPCFDRCQLIMAWVSNIKEVRLHVSVSELRKADRTVVVNCNIFSCNIFYMLTGKYITVNPNRTVSFSKFSFSKRLHLLIRSYQVPGTFDLSVGPFSLSKV